MRGLMTSKTAAAEGPEQMAQQSKSEKVDGFVRQFESGRSRRKLFLALARFFSGSRILLLRLNPAIFHHLTDELVDQIVEFLGIPLATIGQPLLQQALRD